MASRRLDWLRAGHRAARLPEILVVLFIYFGSSQLLLTLSDGFTINLGSCRSRCRCRLRTLTSARSCAA
jgi:cysteine sulfinate desulfinase/cysteine desulfurase-like protein